MYRTAPPPPFPCSSHRELIWRRKCTSSCPLSDASAPSSISIRPTTGLRIRAPWTCAASSRSSRSWPKSSSDRTEVRCTLSRSSKITLTGLSKAWPSSEVWCHRCLPGSAVEGAFVDCYGCAHLQRTTSSSIVLGRLRSSRITPRCETSSSEYRSSGTESALTSKLDQTGPHHEPPGADVCLRSWSFST